MPVYTPSQIKKMIHCEAHLSCEGDVEFILTDSRRLLHADKTLFFAINGAHHNGHQYIDQLFGSGVKNFVVEKSQQTGFHDTANYYVVENAIDALQELAAVHRNWFNYPLVAITGSNGKTIVKEWIFQALSERFNIVRNPRSYNSQIGVPVSVWNMEKEHDLAVFEAGISQPGEMRKLEGILRPNIGIFTNLGDAHQENFTSLQEKANEKIKLFKNAGLLVYCKDYVEIEKAVVENIDMDKTRIINWSLKTEAYLTIGEIKTLHNSSLVSGMCMGKKMAVEIPFTDRGSIENAVHVWCLLIYFNIEGEKINRILSKLQPVEMRLQQVAGLNGCTIINDSYNSDLNSLSIALDYLNQQMQHQDKSVIISDFLQINKNENTLYHQVALVLKEKGINGIIGIGPAIGRNQKYFNGNALFYNDTDTFLKQYDFTRFRNKAILLKGSRSFEFEKIEHFLGKKAHRTILQINLDAIIHNLNYYRSLVKKDTMIMAMVKALSYGSGTYEIAHLLKFHRIDYLGVAYTDEGIELRKAGVTTPVMVMNPDEGNIDQIIEYRLEPEIYSFKILQAFWKNLVTKGESRYPCHIKLDTGMHRLGFMVNEIQPLTAFLKNNKQLYVKSIFSHLAGSDDDNFADKTKNQIALFKTLSEKIMHGIGYKTLRHILNSSGIARFPGAQFDLVRLGIGLYGFAGSSEDKLKNVFTLKTVISQIKELEKGEGIGYNPKTILDKKSKIAVIAIGYADGIDRKLGNGLGKVMIGTKLYPLTGNICMDMCMVDISGSDDVHEGDEVIVFGDHYSAANMAAQLGTIPYEIITSISERIKRIYYKE